MRQYYCIVAAAAVMSFLAACSGRNSSDADAGGEVTAVYDEPDESICEPVTADTGHDTIWKCGGSEYPMRRLDRLSAVDGDRYLSLSLIVPQERTMLTAAMMQLVDSNFYYYTGMRLPRHTLVTTPGSMATVLDAYDKDFARRIIPAEDMDGNACNVTIAAHPAWTDGHIYTYQIYTEADMGGAHPDSEYYYATYDRVSGRLLGFIDIVPLADAQDLRGRLVERLAGLNGMDVAGYLDSVSEYIAGEESGRKHLSPNDMPVYSIARVAQGYVFSYPAGSIAPVEEGAVIVTVPLE